MLTLKRLVFYLFLACLFLSLNNFLLTECATSESESGESGSESGSESSESESGSGTTTTTTTTKSPTTATPTTKSPTTTTTTKSPTTTTTTKSPTTTTTTTTKAPTTKVPTNAPTVSSPTHDPTYQPSPFPTHEPTPRPTPAPTLPTPPPTYAPTKNPTFYSSSCKYVADNNSTSGTVAYSPPDTCLSYGYSTANTNNSTLNVTHTKTYELFEVSQIFECDTSDIYGQTVILRQYNRSDCQGSPYSNQTIRHGDVYDDEVYYIQCGGVDCAAVVREYEVDNCDTDYDSTFLYYSYSDQAFVTSICNTAANYYYEVQCDDSSITYYTGNSCGNQTTSSTWKGCSDNNQYYYELVSCHDYKVTTLAPTKSPTPRSPTSRPTNKPTTPSPTNSPTTLAPSPLPTPAPTNEIVVQTTKSASSSPDLSTTSNPLNSSDASRIISNKIFILLFVAIIIALYN